MSVYSLSYLLFSRSVGYEAHVLHVQEKNERVNP